MTASFSGDPSGISVTLVVYTRKSHSLLPRYSLFNLFLSFSHNTERKPIIKGPRLWYLENTFTENTTKVLAGLLQGVRHSLQSPLPNLRRYQCMPTNFRSYQFNRSGILNPSQTLRRQSRSSSCPRRLLSPHHSNCPFSPQVNCIASTTLL